MNKQRYILLQEAFKARAISKTIKFLKNEVSDKDVGKFIKDIRNLYKSNFNIRIDRIDDNYLDHFKKDKAISITEPEVNNIYGIHSIKYWFSLSDGYMGSTITLPYTLKKFNKGQLVKYNKNGKKIIAKVGDQSGVADNMIKISVDGKSYDIHEDKLEISPESENEEFYSENEEFYKIPYNFNYKELKDGQRAIIDLGRNYKDVEGTIYIDMNDKIYFIHNSPDATGNRPNNNNWKKYGEYSWVIYTNRISNDHSNVRLNNFHKFNLLDIYSEFNIEHTNYVKNTNSNIIDIIKHSDFAVILYLDELLVDEDIDSNEIKIKRNHQKKGATSLISNEDIRKENLNRYIDIIISNIGVSEHEVKDVLNIKNYVMKVLNYDMALYKIYFGSIEDIKKMNNYIYTLINKIEDNSEDAISWFGYIKDIIKKNYTKKYNNNNNKIIYDDINKFKKEGNDIGQIELLNIFKSISEKVANSIRNRKLENLFDLELLIIDIEALKNLLGRPRFSIYGELQTLLYIIYKGGSLTETLNNITEKEIKRNKNSLINIQKYVDIKFNI